MKVKKTGKDIWLPSSTDKTPPYIYLGEDKVSEVGGNLFYSVILFFLASPPTACPALGHTKEVTKRT